ncbi:DMT family transporter [Streptomyces sp. NPDC059788]|uniref:DMT family transporter n=1 Tax=Streptomyces sp. NPDC059788 TaxID=3346948 RepID=UPI003649A22C
MKTKPLGAYGWLLLTMVLWGSAFPSSKFAVEHVPHEVAALFRFGGGAIVLLLITFFRRPQRTPPFKAIVGACVAGLVGVFGYNALFFWGVTMAPASDGGVIFPALTPVITALTLILGGRERARPTRIVGLVIGVCGAALFFVATTVHSGGGSGRLTGDAIFLVGAAVWSVYTLLNRKLVVGMDPVQAVTYSTVAGSLALAVMAAPQFGSVQWGELSGGFWVNAVHLAIGPTAVAYLLYVRGIRDVGASAASVMMFAVPLFSTLFSFAFLGESFTWAQAGAALLMLGGAFLAVVSGHRAAKAATTPQESDGEPAAAPEPATARGPGGSTAPQVREAVAPEVGTS